MDSCTIIILFLIGLLIFTYYTMENQHKESYEKLQKTVNNVSKKPLGSVGGSVSSHDAPLRPTWIKKND